MSEKIACDHSEVGSIGNASIEFRYKILFGCAVFGQCLTLSTHH